MSASESLTNFLKDILVPTVGLVAFALSVVLARKTSRIAQRQNALRLHENFYSANHIMNVVSGVWQIRERWRHTSGPAREEYMGVLALGWVESEHPYVSNEQLFVSANDFFQSEYKRHGLREYECLYLFIYYFVSLKEYIDNGLADRRTIQKLFENEYYYYQPFIKELGNAVRKIGQTRGLVGSVHRNYRPKRPFDVIADLEADVFKVKSLKKPSTPLFVRIIRSLRQGIRRASVQK